MLSRAISIVAGAFEGTLDKGGEPYILHCLRVMDGVQGTERKCIAVMHDLLEDCPDKWSARKLYNAGFNDRIVQAIQTLTHDKAKQTYEDYIKGIALNEDCTAIKLKDLEDNSNITRLKGIGKKDLNRMEKYHKAFLYLSRTEFK